VRKHGRRFEALGAADDDGYLILRKKFSDSGLNGLGEHRRQF
jgi:hypothetical protein